MGEGDVDGSYSAAQAAEGNLGPRCVACIHCKVSATDNRLHSTQFL